MLSKTLLETRREYWRACRPISWLFYGQTKQKPLAPSTAEKIFKIAARKATITKNFSFQSLRHAFATHLLEDGTIRIIQALLGHRGLQLLPKPPLSQVPDPQAGALGGGPAPS